VQYLIHIRDELVPEAHLDADEPHIGQARRCASASQRCALGSMAAEMAGVIVGDESECP
jgi:hypothetical protein